MTKKNIRVFEGFAGYGGASFGLKKAGIKHLKVVYSKELPLTPHEIESAEKKGTLGRTSPGSCSFVPPVAGVILAGEVVKDLISK